MLGCFLAPAFAHAATPQFTISGGGYGHGIGLSQYGARGYALKGWKYDAILKHYFQGTRIATVATAKVKVNLDASGGARSSWMVRAGSDTTLTVTQTSDSSVRATLTKTGTYWISTEGGNTKLYHDTYDASAKKHSRGRLIRTFSGGCTASSGSMVQIVGNSGPFSHSGVRWRGTIRFKPYSASTSKAINYVDIEQYLYGVVPRESPSTWPAESLKAQAVAARSYVWDDARDGRTIYCTTRSQVYNGASRPNYKHEFTSTTAAVNATKGKVVWYGTEKQPVKTYFSSSSGGHTGNVESIWIGATPKPYYTGVTDADQASPNYTWKFGPLSGATLASRIRDKDNGASNTGALDYSVKSPATVTAVKVDRATSGHARYVTLTWSNGATYKIQGDTFRSALSLKSTRYNVITSYPVSSATHYEESSSKLAWTGRWAPMSTASASGGAVRSSSTSDSAALASFSGTGIKVTGPRGPAFGQAQIYVDGKLKHTADLYAAKATPKQVLYSTSALSPGAHELRIVVTRKRNKASTGYSVAIDAIDVTNGSLASATAPLKRYQQTSGAMAKLGPWSTVKGGSYSGSSVVRTSAKSSLLYATFYGSEVRWIGTAAPTYGKARVSIDGSKPTTVTITSSTTAYQKVLFKRTGLSQDRAHTLRIESLGVGSGGTAGLCAVDAIEVRGGWLLDAQVPVQTLEEDSSRLVWTGAWTRASGSSTSGGFHSRAKSRGAACTVAFEGVGIEWIAKTGTGYGRARVYLDGVDKGVVDLYSSASRYGQVPWRSGRLPAGTHTLKIVAAGTKRTAATAAWVSVDNLRIEGRAIKP